MGFERLRRHDRFLRQSSSHINIPLYRVRGLRRSNKENIQPSPMYVGPRFEGDIGNDEGMREYGKGASGVMLRMYTKRKNLASVRGRKALAVILAGRHMAVAYCASV